MATQNKSTNKDEVWSKDRADGEDLNDKDVDKLINSSIKQTARHIPTGSQWSSALRRKGGWGGWWGGRKQRGTWRRRTPPAVQPVVAPSRLLCSTLRSHDALGDSAEVQTKHRLTSRYCHFQTTRNFLNYSTTPQNLLQNLKKTTDKVLPNS